MVDPSTGREPGPQPHTDENPVVRFVRARWLPIVLVILLVVFVAQNRKHVSIDMFWVHIKSPLWFILALTAIAGVIIGLVTARRRAQSRSRAPKNR
jgi:uncharacterized integral membrane protein